MPYANTEIRAKSVAARRRSIPRSTAAQSGQTCKYTLTLWEELASFLEHSELELSNNLAGNSMMPVALGRSN